MGDNRKMPESDFYRLMREAEDRRLSKMTEEEREKYFEQKEKEAIELAKRLQLNVVKLKAPLKPGGKNE